MQAKFTFFQQLQKVLRFLFLIALIILVAPILIFLMLFEAWNRHVKRFKSEAQHLPEKLTKNHLEEKLSLDDIEAREYVYDPLNAVPHLPFGHNNSLWVRFKSKLEEDDELWSFSAVLKNDFGQRQKEKGYAVLRDSQIQSCYYVEKYVILEQHPIAIQSEAPNWWQLNKLNLS